MFIDLARKRKTCRIYSDDPLTEEEMSLIEEAGRIAPSSRNLKDVRVVPVRDIALIRRLALCKDGSTTPLETATFAVIVAADPAVCDVWIEDASIATIMMQLEAEDLGLGSCWIQVRLRGTSEESAASFIKREVGLDSSWEVLSIVAFGRRLRWGSS